MSFQYRTRSEEASSFPGWSSQEGDHVVECARIFCLLKCLPVRRAHLGQHHRNSGSIYARNDAPLPLQGRVGQTFLCQGPQCRPPRSDCRMVMRQACDGIWTPGGALCLVFDWWVRNDDRNLTQLGGNPNLLWDTSRAQLVVIDHNAAFSMDFSATDFRRTHIFAAEWTGIVEDWIHRSHYQQRLANAYAMLEEALASCPPSWFWADFGVPAQFDPEAVRFALRRFDQPDFWDLAP